GAPTAAGTYDVTVTATDSAGEAVSDTFALVVAAADPVVFQPIAIQAESGTITLVAPVDGSSTMVRDPDNPESNPNLPTGLRPGFTGTGYLDFGNDGGDTVTYTVEVAEAGQYDLNIRYASNGARPLVLAVNNGVSQTLPFLATGTNTSGPTEGFNNWSFQTATISLVAGQNTISLAIPPGATVGPNLDRIEITAAGTGPIPTNQAPTAVTVTPVNVEVLENTDYAAGIKVADIAVTDADGGTNTLGL
ncbi:delta endotoxin C-terminal domain-containing protein, partial [Microvirga sp. GCM10011540]|uniref:delta endotoxin C-terminal domain-containing protein n=1 Tax=Microvirga sp. GCM10011540 TaxID=3317338 RepID=UPI00361ECE14